MFASGVIDNMVVGGPSSVPAPLRETRDIALPCRATGNEDPGYQQEGKRRALLALAVLSVSFLVEFRFECASREA